MRIGWSLAVMALAACASSHGKAQDCSENSPRAEAAREAMAQWQLTRAADLLRESLDECPHPRTAHNLAGVLRELGKPTDALAVLDGLLRGSFGELNNEDAEAARAQRRDTLQALATLDILVEGAEQGRISVDGRDAAIFRGGERRTIRLDPGAHRLRLRAPRFLSIERDITLDAGQSDELAVTFPEGPRGLLILKGPTETPLVVDGHARGAGQVRLRLAPGRHRISAGELGERTIMVRGGTIVEQAFEEAPVPLRRKTWFWVLLGSTALGVAAAIILGTLLPVEPQSVSHPVLGNQET